MSQPTLIDIPHDAAPQEQVSLKSDKKPVKKVEYELDKPELSDRIQKFDRKVKVHTSDPFAFNTVAKRQVSISPTQTAERMIMVPTYNQIGKFLGVDTVNEWNKAYDKVYTIAEWAKKETGTDNLYKLMQWISRKAKTVPTIGNKRIDELYLFAKMHFNKHGSR